MKLMSFSIPSVIGADTRDEIGISFGKIRKKVFKKPSLGTLKKAGLFVAAPVVAPTMWATKKGGLGLIRKAIRPAIKKTARHVAKAHGHDKPTKSDIKEANERVLIAMSRNKNPLVKLGGKILRKSGTGVSGDEIGVLPLILPGTGIGIAGAIAAGLASITLLAIKMKMDQAKGYKAEDMARENVMEIARTSSGLQNEVGLRLFRRKPTKEVRIKVRRARGIERSGSGKENPWRAEIYRRMKRSALTPGSDYWKFLSVAGRGKTPDEAAEMAKQAALSAGLKVVNIKKPSMGAELMGTLPPPPPAIASQVPAPIPGEPADVLIAVAAAANSMGIPPEIPASMIAAQNAGDKGAAKEIADALAVYQAARKGKKSAQAQIAAVTRDSKARKPAAMRRAAALAAAMGLLKGRTIFIDRKQAQKAKEEAQDRAQITSQIPGTTSIPSRWKLIRFG